MYQSILRLFGRGLNPHRDLLLFADFALALSLWEWCQPISELLRRGAVIGWHFQNGKRK